MFLRRVVSLLAERVSIRHRYRRHLFRLTNDSTRSDRYSFLAGDIEDLGKGFRIRRAFRTNAELDLLRQSDFAREFLPFRDALEARNKYQAVAESRTGLVHNWFRFIGLRFAVEDLARPAPLRRSVVLGSKIRHTLNHKQTLDNQRASFFEQVHGRRVLVLGPAQTVPRSSLDIGEFDVICAPKLYFGGWADDVLKKVRPHHTLVSYVNHWFLGAFLEDEASEFEGIHYLRLKTKQATVKARRALRNAGNTGPTVGQAVSPAWIMDNHYGPLMGPHMIYDVLHGTPKEVYVSGFSFYLSGYSSGGKDYPTGSQGKDSQLQSLRGHEPFSNFTLVKNLWSFGLISVDEEMERTLQLTKKEYADALDAEFELTSGDSSTGLLG